MPDKDKPVLVEPERPSGGAGMELGFGERLLMDLDPERNILPVKTQEQILAISSEEQLQGLLHADLSGVVQPDFADATRYLQGLMKTEIKIPQMLMVFHFYTIEQCLATIRECDEIYRNPKEKRKERYDARRAKLEALKAMSALTDRLFRLAQRVDGSGVAPEKTPIKRKKTDAAPEVAPQPRRQLKEF